MPYNLEGCVCSEHTLNNEHSYYIYSAYADGWKAGNKGKRYYNEDLDTAVYPKRYGDIFVNEGAQIRMGLNMNERTIRYDIDGKDQGVAFKDICFKNDEKYNVCVCFDEAVTVQLIDYHHIP